jgi:hypothetical protein
MVDGTIQTSIDSCWCNFTGLQDERDVCPQHLLSAIQSVYKPQGSSHQAGYATSAALFLHKAFWNRSKTAEGTTQNSRCHAACQPKISDAIFPSVSPLKKLASSLPAISYLDYVLSIHPLGLPSPGDHPCSDLARSLLASPPCVLSLVLRREGSHDL